MSDTVYTMFGYGQIVPALKPTVEGVKKAVLEVNDQSTGEQISEANIVSEVKDSSSDPEDKLLKITFKWGGVGYIPVG